MSKKMSLKDWEGHVQFWYDDEDIKEKALEYGNPEPDKGICNNLRKKIAKRAYDHSQNHSNFSIDTDGKKVIISNNNKESLIHAFSKNCILD